MNAATSEHTSTGVAVNHAQIGRDFVINLVRSATTSRFAGQIRRFLNSYLVVETGTVLFDGRDQELECLDHWLDDLEGEPRFLLTGSMGRGKSALLTHWLMRLQKKSRLGTGEGAWRPTFVPISIRFGTNHPNVFYEAIAAHLAGLLETRLEPHIGPDPVAYYQDQCSALLDKAITQQVRILVVIDGIDEALGDSFQATWFPNVPGPFLRLLLSARLQLETSDAHRWLDRFGWRANVRVRTMNLPPLRRQSIQDLLIKALGPGRALDIPPKIVDRLYELSAGEPFLLGYYLKDLSQCGDKDHLDIEALGAITPGLRAYFDNWLRDQKNVWEAERKGGADIEETTLFAYLAVLACAYGPLTAPDLNSLARRVANIPPTFRTDHALHPVRRFVLPVPPSLESPDAGYALAHPTLGEFFRKYFDADVINRVREGFVEWGRDTLRQLASRKLAPEKASSYLLQFLSQHFEDAEASASDFMGLVEEYWLHAWQEFAFSAMGFSLDVRKAQKVAAHADAAGAPTWARLLRCKLVLSSVSSVHPQPVMGPLIVECAKDGILSLQHALRYVKGLDNGDRIYALMDLAVALPNAPRDALLTTALRIIQRIEDSDDRATMLIHLARSFNEVERKELHHSVLYVADQIADDGPRARALLAVASVPPAWSPGALPPASAAAGRAEHESQTTAADLLALHPTAAPSPENRSSWTDVEPADDSWLDPWAIAQLALRLPKTADHSAVLSKACEANDAELRARVLTYLAPHLDPKNRLVALRAAIQAAEQLESPEIWKVFAHLAPRLVEPLVTEALAAARRIKSDWWRGFALGAMVSCVPGNIQKEVLAEALRLAQAEVNGPAVVQFLLPHLHEAERLNTVTQLLRDVSEQIVNRHSDRAFFGPRDFWHQAVTLERLAPHLPPPLLEDALSMAQRLEFSDGRAYAVAGLARFLPKPTRRRLLEQTLQALPRIGDSVGCFEALVRTVPYLPPAAQGEAMRTAVALAQQIRDPDDRALSLVRFAALLPEDDRLELCRAALDAALHSSSRGSIFWASVEAVPWRDVKIDVLLSLAPTLPSVLLPEALDLARQISDAQDRVEVLAAIAGGQGEPDRGSVLTQALQDVMKSNDRAKALQCLAPHLSLSLLDSVVPIALDIRDRESRFNSLYALAPHLPETQRATVLAELRRLAQRGKITWSRASTLTDLAPLLLGLDRTKALRAASRVVQKAALWNWEHGEFCRYMVLAKLAPQLPEKERSSLLSAAVETVTSVYGDRPGADGDKGRADALSELAPHLSLVQLQAGLKRASQIADAESRARALAGLIPYLPYSEREGPGRAALHAVDEIAGEEVEERIFKELATHLPTAVLETAFETARRIKGVVARARALAAIAPRLPEPLQQLCLAPFAIDTDGVKRGIIVELLPQFYDLVKSHDGEQGIRELQRSLRDVMTWFP